ncbi:MAG TPA: SGNH/GDSL hydrolase family protein [Verrucomicrobiae bacterium]|jgi:phospholipase/lecithinase/hemolysin|nr:SGNH/GDSL hydrolase family protein [Verrucomicrobiae bacterium]
MKHKLRGLFVVLALFLNVSTGYSFTALYAFGDSLSDTGRNPPTQASSYFNGRYSNGPLWVEYLSASLGLPYNAANNFAVSGSVTSDLQTEIASLPAFPNLQTALFTIESGGNDFLQNAGLGTNDAAWSVVVSNAVENLTNAIATLYADGAREILVLNLPNLGQTPFFNTSSANYRVYVDSKVAAFNGQFESVVSNANQQIPGLRIYMADFNQMLTNILNAPADYGFTVSTIGALQDPALTDKSFTGPGANYVFWDPIHPTTKGHAMMSALAFQRVGVQLNVARSGANFNLTVNNLYPSLPYTIQSSANLVTWSNYQTFTAVNTNAVVTVTNGPGAMSFYRVGY